MGLSQEIDGTFSFYTFGLGSVSFQSRKSWVKEHWSSAFEHKNYGVSQEIDVLLHSGRE